MSIAAPATNPASDLELKLPATIGSAGQVLANSSTAGTLEFIPPGAIINVSPLAHESSNAGVVVNNTTSNVGALCSITRKSATSNFIILMIFAVYRPSISGWIRMKYRRQVNSDTQSADLEQTKVLDADTVTNASYIVVDTTTGSVGDVVKIQPRGENTGSTDSSFRYFKTIIFEFEP